MNILKKVVTLAIVGAMSLSVSVTCFAKDPTADMSVKERITYYKNHTPDEEKSESLLVVMDKSYDINEYISKVATQYDFSKIELVGTLSFIGTENLYTIECGNVKESDTAVDLFNAYDEVKYAEPNYIQHLCM